MTIRPTLEYIHIMNTPKPLRKSHVAINNTYFWTATINNWQLLLLDDTMKLEIIHSLQWLVTKKLVSIYGYVIMPNHIHILWSIHATNNNELPHSSFLKYTAHRFKSILNQKNPKALDNYRVNAQNKQYEFWQRDSFAMKIESRKFLIKKIEYIHKNPLAKKWNLCRNIIDYNFSSAKYYELGIDDYNILTHVGEIY